MSTVAEITATRKAPQAFYAHLFDASGALTKVHGTLYFVAEDATITEVEPDMCNYITVLGAMTLSDGQRIADLMAGGAAVIACSRMEGVA